MGHAPPAEELTGESGAELGPAVGPDAARDASSGEHMAQAAHQGPGARLSCDPGHERPAREAVNVDQERAARPCKIVRRYCLEHPNWVGRPLDEPVEFCEVDRESAAGYGTIRRSLRHRDDRVTPDRWMMHWLDDNFTRRCHQARKVENFYFDLTCNVINDLQVIFLPCTGSSRTALSNGV